jgi:hypothetical protein
MVMVINYTVKEQELVRSSAKLIRKKASQVAGRGKGTRGKGTGG